MSEISQKIIKQTEEKDEQNKIKYNNPSWGEENIALTIAAYMENFIENRYKDLIKKEKSEIYTLTHSYMDVLQTEVALIFFLILVLDICITL